MQRHAAYHCIAHVTTLWPDKMCVWYGFCEDGCRQGSEYRGRSVMTDRPNYSLPWSASQPYRSTRGLTASAPLRHMSTDETLGEQ